jgi:hypothetical protein
MPKTPPAPPPGARPRWPGPAARRRGAVLGEHARPQHQQQRHHRHRQQKHRAPPEAPQQHPTRQRADRAAGREAGDPDADGGGALPGVGEHAEDQRQRGRRQGRPGDPQQRAGGDQHPGAGRQGGEHGDDPEGGGAAKQQPAAADAVAEGAHGDQEPRDHEPVDVGDPQQLGAAGPQVGADGRDGQVQHGQVHRVQQAGQREHRQPGPLPPPGPQASPGQRRVVHMGVPNRFFILEQGCGWPPAGAGRPGRSGGRPRPGTARRPGTACGSDGRHPGSGRGRGPRR